MTSPRRRRAITALGAALVFATALAARWRWGANQDGPNFEPKPDAIEYAASAMALVQTGRFYLQVGPVQARPHYSPGWPAALAAALALGVEPRQVWRLTGLLGAGLAVLLAGAARSAVTTLRDGADDAAWGGLAAGLLAGTGWALAPCAVAVGRTLLSDEPAALAAFASLLLLAGGLARQCLPSRRARAGDDSSSAGFSSSNSPSRDFPSGASPSRDSPSGDSSSGASPSGDSPSDASRSEDSSHAGPPARRGHLALWYGGAGITFGLTLAIRPVEGVLLAIPELLLLALAARRLRSPRAWLPVAGWWSAGAALPAAAVMAILVRSGLPPLAWTGYGFWWPAGAAQLQDAFSLRNVWTAEPALALLGLPGLPWDWYLGRFWPLLGWLAAPWLWAAARDRARRDPRSRIVLWVLAALALWTLGRIVLFSCYFASAARFFLPAQAVCLLLLATALGLAVADARPPRRLSGIAASLCLLAAIAGSFAAFRRAIEPGNPQERVYKRFNRWIQLTDEQRASQEVPFDPLDAQALGLLDPEIVADIHQWGDLPPTYHVRRLRKKGLLPP